MIPGLKDIQQTLKEMNHDPGPVDGLWGPRTKGGLESLEAHEGQPIPDGDSASKPPWILEGEEVFGFHETYDQRALSEWLVSDGKTLGNPDALPWCGDFTETCMKLGLPNEPFTGDVGKNPYWARNWTGFGRKCPVTRYCVGSFSRGSGGHVGFIVGEDGAYYVVFGGNQSDKVGYTKVAKSRLLASRWPLTYNLTHIPLKDFSGRGIPTTVNEV